MRSVTRTWWGREFIVIKEPFLSKRGHLFELKVNQALIKGYSFIGVPQFLVEDKIVIGIISMEKKK